jgi:hypothetical protein
MQHLPMGYMARGHLRLVYSDRVVSRWPDADATSGDLAVVLGELLGHPVAFMAMHDLHV